MWWWRISAPVAWPWPPRPAAPVVAKHHAARIEPLGDQAEPLLLSPSLAVREQSILDRNVDAKDRVAGIVAFGARPSFLGLRQHVLA